MTVYEQITELTPHLYVSGVAPMTSLDKLKSLGINLIVNASNLSYKEIFDASDVLCQQISNSSASSSTGQKGGEFNGGALSILCVPVQDQVQANLLPYFQAVADLIRANEERGGKTLVHCLAGVSRSVSLCIAYLITHYQPSPSDLELVAPQPPQNDCKAAGSNSDPKRFTVYQALSFVHSKRKIANPNAGFRQQLLTFESKIRSRHCEEGEQTTPSSDFPDEQVSKLLDKGGQDALFLIHETTRKLRESI